MLRAVGLEIAASAGISKVTTNATGANWQPLPDLACSQICLYNNSGTALELSYGAADGSDIVGQEALPVADGVAQPLRGISSAKLIRVRRVDQSNTQVTVKFTYEGVRGA